MRAHFRRMDRTKSLRSDKEFPNVFQRADLPKNKDLTAIEAGVATPPRGTRVTSKHNLNSRGCRSLRFPEGCGFRLSTCKIPDGWLNLPLDGWPGELGGWLVASRSDQPDFSRSVSIVRSVKVRTAP